ncbi:MAG: hypothetical protein JXR03_09710 [Cyclobacteriaceae bacterium]
MKKTNHIILILSLLVFVWSEVSANHPLNSINSTTENRAEAEAEPSASILLSTLNSLVRNNINAKISTTFIHPFLIGSEQAPKKQHLETKKLFIIHGVFLI